MQPASAAATAKRTLDTIGADVQKILKDNVPALAPTASATQPVLSPNDETTRPSYASPAPDLPTHDEQAAASDSDLPTTIQRCYVSHPGSMCCSTASIKRDHAAATCVVTVQTTVRVTQPGATVAMHDMEELGWVTVQHTAADLVTAWNQQAAHPQEAGPQNRHELITRMLEHGKIVDAEKRSVNSYGHISYIVTLKDKQTNCKIRAFFKPRVVGDCGGWHRVTAEEVAYRLNMLLGMDYVPPTVYRKTADVDWQTFKLGGAFMYWCEDALELRQLPTEDWGLDPAVLLSDTRILDVLIQNSDRHTGHFLMAQHWSNGSGGPTNWTGQMRPVLVDQAAGFRPDAYVALEHDNAFGTGPTERISARTYLRLRFLNLATLQESLGTLLTPQEMVDVIARRDTVLRFFDGLVEKRGYQAVVIENC